MLRRQPISKLQRHSHQLYRDQYYDRSLSLCSGLGKGLSDNVGAADQNTAPEGVVDIQGFRETTQRSHRAEEMLPSLLCRVTALSYESVVLQMISMDLLDARQYPFIEPPSTFLRKLSPLSKISVYILIGNMLLMKNVFLQLQTLLNFVGTACGFILMCCQMRWTLSL